MVTNGVVRKSTVSHRLLVILLVVSFLLTAISAAASVSTWGILSLGKFYKYSVQPSSSYPDHWPVITSGNQISDGSKLTDEANASPGWPLDNWVGWPGVPVDITIDLGKTYTISHVYCDAASRTSWGIYFPPSVTVYTSTDGATWTGYDTLYFPTDTSTFSTYQAISNNGDPIYRNARYIKYSAASNGWWTFIDELSVGGSIEQTSKYVPAAGCYHGCYDVDGNGWMDWQAFESMISPKTVKMVLWYADFQTSFQNSIGYMIDDWYALQGRYLQIGFLPYNTTAAQIASGSHDQFLADWCTACKNKDYPIWIRPMNEMNGEWTWPDNNTSSCEYGGDPLSYRRAWRRMYNIAENVGCTGDKQIWDWSPSTIEYLLWKPNTNMELYYPGDQYVDWVGLSVYDDNNGKLPEQWIDRAYNLYSNKPMMISEGGCQERTWYPDWKGDSWIPGWFSSIQNTYMQIKAAVWFNNLGFEIESSSNSQQHYHDACQSSYWIGQ